MENEREKEHLRDSIAKSLFGCKATTCQFREPGFPEKDNNQIKERLDFRDFDIRVWGNGDLSIHAKDMQCFVSDTHIGAQTNTTDKDMNAMIEAVCGNIREDFKKLNELLDRI